jgi:hypothetical protein
MLDAASAIHIARSQVGYHEARSAGHWNNNQKYSDQLPGFAWSDKQPWCDTFVQWCFWQTSISIPKGAVSASCRISCDAYKKAGRFTEYPVIGGQVFYGPNGGTHTGLVYDYNDTQVMTVEGNTNTSGSAEGDGVYLKVRNRHDAYVFGYGIPYYQGKAVSADPKWNGKSLAA